MQSNWCLKNRMRYIHTVRGLVEIVRAHPDVQRHLLAAQLGARPFAPFPALFLFSVS
jgi:hypothetical protein